MILFRDFFNYADLPEMLAAGWEEQNPDNHTITITDHVVTIERVVDTASGLFMNLPVVSGQPISVTVMGARVSGSGSATLRLGDGEDQLATTTWDATTTSETPELLSTTITPTESILTIYLRKNGTQTFTFSELVVDQVWADDRVRMNGEGGKGRIRVNGVAQ